ncbi:MAG: hypothetical protein ACYDG2_13225 [Ruminiclostridium sp.]
MYKDLIEAGIIHITPPKGLYCRECFQKEVLGIKQPIDIKSYKIDFIHKAKIVVDSYDKSNKILLIKIENMTEFFPDHEELFELNEEQVKSISGISKRSGVDIKDRSFVDKFISSYIDDEFSSVCYYAEYCNNQKAKLIKIKYQIACLLNLQKKKNL